MKKATGLSSLLIVFLAFFITLVSCKKEKFDIEENNRLFFLKYAEHYDDGISLDKLSLYYYESYFYYDVEGKDSEKDYHFLYIFRYKQFQIWYSIKYPEQDKEYYPSSYNNYLLAKEKGESKIYSEEELELLKETYYNKQ